MTTTWAGRLAAAAIVALTVSGGSPARADTSVQRSATAVWTVVDGCVETRIVVFSSTTGGTVENFFFLTRQQSCDDPNVVQPVLDVTGEFTGGRLLVPDSLRSGSLATTGPVTCVAYEAGACDSAPFDAGSVTLTLTWTASGPIVRSAGEQSCRFRYGGATGSISLGGVDLLAGVVVSDPTETDVGICTT